MSDHTEECLYNSNCSVTDCQCPCHRVVGPEARPGYIEVIHIRASEPEELVTDLVRWPGDLPRKGEFIEVWGDEDWFRYEVKGVCHHVETQGGEDRLVMAAVYVGLYTERGPRGSAGPTSRP